MNHEVVNIVIGLIPAIAWGLMPLVVSKIGGTTANQLLGTALGTFILALILTPFLPFSGDATVFWVSFISGAFWAIGQLGQYQAFKDVGVSTAMPISTGLQLIGTSLIGVLFLHEWDSNQAKLIGFGAILLIIIGVLLTTFHEKGIHEDAYQDTRRRGLIILIISSLGYLGYSTLPKLFKITDGRESFLPQALGMLVAAFVISLLLKEAVVVKQKQTYQNIIVGIFFGVGSLTYLISSSPDFNGVANGFTLSQMNVVISTLGGILVLHEHKTKKELIFTLLGLVLVIIGGVMTATIPVN